MEVAPAHCLGLSKRPEKCRTKEPSLHFPFPLELLATGFGKPAGVSPGRVNLTACWTGDRRKAWIFPY